MRTLFITRTNPFLKNGGAYATKAYIDGFKDLSADFTLMLPDNCTDNRAQYVDTHIIKVPERSLIDKLLFPITGVSHRFIPYIYNLAKLNCNFSDYDTIVLNGGVLSGSMIKFFKTLNKKVITLHHNVEVNYHIDNRTIDSFWGYNSHFVRKNEKRALVQSDLNLSISYSDIYELKELYQLNPSISIEYLGCFEDKRREPPLPSPTVVSKKAIITGSLKDVQTNESILNFLDSLYPVFKKECQDWTLTIAGRDPGKDLIRKAEILGINLVVNPENMDSLIREHDLYICPTNMGSGLKLRIMDGLRNGLPILTHKVSARGYEKFWDKDYFRIYFDTKQFLNALSQITKSEIPKDRIIEAYLKEFSYSAGKNRLKQLLTKKGFL